MFLDLTVVTGMMVNGWGKPNFSGSWIVHFIKMFGKWRARFQRGGPKCFSTGVSGWSFSFMHLKTKNDLVIRCVWRMTHSDIVYLYMYIHTQYTIHYIYIYIHILTDTVDGRNPASPWMENPINNGINHLSTGAIFLPSTVCIPLNTIKLDITI